MYRNYDGNKSTFGDTSIQTTVPNPDNLSAFSAVRTSDGALTLMVINKDINNATPVIANLANFNATGTAQRWQLTSGNVITRLTDVSFANSVLKDTVPSQSITLYVLSGRQLIQPQNRHGRGTRTTHHLAQWSGGAGLSVASLHRSRPLVGVRHKYADEQFISIFSLDYEHHNAVLSWLVVALKTL